LPLEVIVPCFNKQHRGGVHVAVIDPPAGIGRADVLWSSVQPQRAVPTNGQQSNGQQQQQLPQPAAQRQNQNGRKQKKKKAVAAA